MIRIKQILPVIFISLIVAACTTMPPEIEDKYLAEKSDSQSKVIADLEQKIIDKNKEKQAAAKKSNELVRLTIRTEEEITLLKKENTVLKDQVYLYEKNKDAVNLEPKKKQLAENDAALTKKISMLQYQMAEKKLSETDLELKNAELALLISELGFEKSKIAAEYRDKNEPEKPDKEQNFFTSLFNKKDPKDKYGYKKYGEYMDKKKEEKVKAGAAYREAEKQFLDVKKSMEGTK